MVLAFQLAFLIRHPGIARGRDKKKCDVNSILNQRYWTFAQIDEFNINQEIRIKQP
jgi:hypothetical protein